MIGFEITVSAVQNYDTYPKALQICVVIILKIEVNYGIILKCIAIDLAKMKKSKMKYYFRGANMTVSYNKLWKLCIDHQMKKSDIARATSMSPSTLAKLGKNEPVSLETLMRICKVFHCDIGDICEILFDD